jgi:DNA-binding transcriptional ArsR family regulator
MLRVELTAAPPSRPPPRAPASGWCRPWDAAPSASLSSDGRAPIVLACPVPLPADWTPETGPLSDRAIDELIGPSRSMLLTAIAAGPGQGTRELARRTGFAPASVSEHTQILRRAGLTEASQDGTRVTHQLSPLGWALLLRPS